MPGFMGFIHPTLAETDTDVTGGVPEISACWAALRDPPYTRPRGRELHRAPNQSLASNIIPAL